MAWSCIRLVNMVLSDLHRDCGPGALGRSSYRGVARVPQCIRAQVTWSAQRNQVVRRYIGRIVVNVVNGQNCASVEREEAISAAFLAHPHGPLFFA